MNFFSPSLFLLAFSVSRTVVARPSAVNNTAFLASHLGKITATGATAAAAGFSSTTSSTTKMTAARDPDYPGTAVTRMLNVRERVKGLTENDLNGPWEQVRRRILWAGGLRDLPNAVPGQGYTGHSFNDFNHVDLTCMDDGSSNNQHDGESIPGIARGNLLGPGIRVASLPELGPGGSWSTCALGCNQDPPRDVAHVQFQARIAFKLVWVPNDKFDAFVLVDDDGAELARGKPTGQLPSLRERRQNYAIMKGSKYAKVADMIASNVSAE